MGDAVLINGVVSQYSSNVHTTESMGQGQTNCSNADIQDHTLPCDPPANYEIPVPVGQRIRFRILNIGAGGEPFH